MSYKELNQKTEEYKYCIECGWKIPVKDQKCPYCNQNQSESLNDQQNKTDLSPENRSTFDLSSFRIYFYIVAFMFMPLGIILGLLYSTTNKEGAKKIIVISFIGVMIRYLFFGMIDLIK